MRVRLGRRCLYDALGVELGGHGPIQQSSSLEDGREVLVYIGPTPPNGNVAMVPGDQFFVPGRAANLGQTRRADEATCFLEVVVSTPRDLDAHEAARLTAGEQSIRESLLQEAAADTALHQLAEAVCGVLGLRFHRQFVLSLLIETPVVLGGPVPLTQIAGSAVQMLEQLSVNAGFAPRVASFVSGLSTTAPRAIKKAGSTMFWLVRAWRTRDRISAFMFFFVALETLLDAVVLEEGEIDQSAHLYQQLVELAAESSVAEDTRATLLSSLASMKGRFGPSFGDRFERLAQLANIDGWKQDVVAVRRFNRLRNLLLHCGENRVLDRVVIEEEVRTLEDIVERYAAQVFFGSPEVYPSRWRPNRA